MLPLVVSGDELQLGRGETVEDTARVLSGYCSAIAVRTFEHARLQGLAGAATVPVINALSDDHHPCQALADLLTLHERFGRLEGLRIAYVGDATNVAHSLLETGARSGMDVATASPRGYQPDPERERRLDDLRPYQVDAPLMRAARDDAVFMHCLPAHRGQEVSAEVIDGSRSIVFEQAANRLPIAQALVHDLVRASEH
jgi:ornithine carbamoyltransferase